MNQPDGGQQKVAAVGDPPPSEVLPTGPAAPPSATGKVPALPAITQISLRRFKQFRELDVELHPGTTLVAGANNAGKSTLLHALAVWEFCRTATLNERGREGILPGATTRQGFGLGDDEFSPINVPSLKHLWTNLKTAKTPEDPDGYTLSICCRWMFDGESRKLGFALALANDRLFIKVAESNLGIGEPTPICAYLPPFAGIRAREERVGGAIRRRRIGEGLAGAVLRNLLLDMYQTNLEKRTVLKSSKPKISDADLKTLREEDPWELLQQTLRQVFNAEVQLDDFSEEYHSYIKAEVVKGDVTGHKLTRYPHFNPRDLMVEGSGFLQWLSVYTLAVSSGVSVLLFDEPDAHLHPSLQQEMVATLRRLSSERSKQALVATHSAEILRAANPNQILNVTRSSAKYLSFEHQKVGMLAGLGADFSPRIDKVRSTRRLLFVEGSSDLTVLKIFARTLKLDWPDQWVEWQTTEPHRGRKHLWTSMVEEFGEICAVSLRDRDDEPLGTVGAGGLDKVYSDFESQGFLARKWRRRHIESYLIWPAAIASASGISIDQVNERLAENYGVAVGGSFTLEEAPQALLNLNGKAILNDFEIKAAEVAKHLPAEAVCEDVRALLDLLCERAGSSPD